MCVQWIVLVILLSVQRRIWNMGLVLVCSVNDDCQCQKQANQENCLHSVCLSDEESDVLFCVGSEEISWGTVGAQLSLGKLE